MSDLDHAFQELFNLFHPPSQNQQEDANAASSSSLPHYPPLAFHLTSSLQAQSRDAMVDAALGMLGLAAPTLYRSLSDILFQNLVSVLLASVRCGNLRTCACVTAEAVAAAATSRMEGGSEGIVADVDSRHAERTKQTSRENKSVNGPRRCGSVEPLIGCSLSTTALMNIIDSCDRFLKTTKVHNAQGLLFAGHRYLIWRIEPQVLKKDLSILVQQAAERPLLLLNLKWKEQDEWQNLAIGMVYGPEVFAEARRLLSAWFLYSGATCVLDVLIELAAMVRDVLEQPMSWGLSVEAGLDLPPLDVFYGRKLHVYLRSLTRPVTLVGLMQLVTMLEHAGSEKAEALCPLDEDVLIFGCEVKASKMFCEQENVSEAISFFLQDSVWPLLMNFPSWSQFASLLLFQQYAFHPSDWKEEAIAVESARDAEWLATSQFQEIAAKYLGWLVSPYDKNTREFVVKKLVEVANKWLCMQGLHVSHYYSEESQLESHGIKRRKLILEDTGRQNPPGPENEQKSRVDDVAFQHHFYKEDHESNNGPDTEPIPAVKQWLEDLSSFCWLLESSQGRSVNGGSDIGSESHFGKTQTSEMLHMCDGGIGCRVVEEGYETTATVSNDGFNQSPIHPSCKRTYCFFDNLPLAALAANPRFLSHDIVRLVLEFIVYNNGCVMCTSRRIKGDRKTSLFGLVCSAGTGSMVKNDLLIKEPAHRTEDFKDLGDAPVFPHCASACWAVGAATIFRFLERVDSKEMSELFREGTVTDWLSGFKEMVGKHLLEHVHNWSKHADSHHLTVLADFHRRFSLWVAQAGLGANVTKIFYKILQQLDILIASLLSEI